MSPWLSFRCSPCRDQQTEQTFIFFWDNPYKPGHGESRTVQHKICHLEVKNDSMRDKSTRWGTRTFLLPFHAHRQLFSLYPGPFPTWSASQRDLRLHVEGLILPASSKGWSPAPTLSQWHRDGPPLAIPIAVCVLCVVVQVHGDGHL